MRVVLDTNIIVSQAISPHGPSARIFASWQQRAFDLLVTGDVLNEYAQTLGRASIQRRSRMSDADVSAVIANLVRFATVVVPEHRIIGVSADPDDDIFLECALAGSADYIVSGDQHLLSLGDFRGIAIVPPAVFMLVLDDLKQP